MAELRRRGYPVDLADVVGAINIADLHGALGPADLEDLIRYLPGNGKRDKYRVKARQVLTSRLWGSAVADARRRLGLPADGLKTSDARALHNTLLDTILDHATTSIARQTLEFWAQVIIEARALSAKIGLDPSPLDDMRIDISAGDMNLLIGVRKLIDPQGVFRIGGREVDYLPTDADRIIGHLVWGLELCVDDLLPGPFLRLKWELMPDGRGRILEETFIIEDASPSELRALTRSLRQIRREFKRRALSSIRPSGTWKDRWVEWNRFFPDMEVPSPDALRKAVSYARRRR